MKPTRRGAALLALGSLIMLGACSNADSPGTDDGSAGATKPPLHAMLPERIQESGEITFGALWETPPIISIDPADTSTPVGITPDLAEELGKVLGVTPVWKNMQWPAQLPGLDSGNVDVLFGQVSDGPEREEVIDIIGFYRSPMGLLVSPDDAGVTSMMEMCGRSIGVPQGSSQKAIVDGNSALCVENGEGEIKVVEYPGAQNAIVALTAGTVDAWMDATTSTARIAEESGGEMASIALPSEEVDQHAPRGVGLAMSKQQPELTEALLAAMKEIYGSGAYAAVMEEWGAADAVMPEDEIVINLYTGIPAGGSADDASQSG